MSTESTNAIIASEERTSPPSLVSTPPLRSSMEEQELQKPQQPSSESSEIFQKNSESLLPTAMATTIEEKGEEKAVDKHVFKRLSTAMSLASDSEEEPAVIVTADKLSSRNSAPSFEDLKLNTVSWVFVSSKRFHVQNNIFRTL